MEYYPSVALIATILLKRRRIRVDTVWSIFRRYSPCQISQVLRRDVDDVCYVFRLHEFEIWLPHGLNYLKFRCIYFSQLYQVQITNEKH